MRRIGFLILVLLLALPLMAQTETTFEYEGFAFVYDESLGEPEAEVIEAAEEELPYTDWVPEHIRITFDGYPVEREDQQARILIIPRDAYEAVASDLIQAVIADLENSLSQGVVLPQFEPLPYLPLSAGTQVIQAHADYFDFVDGEGIFYLTAYQTEISPVTNNELIFTFQIATDDYFISATFPVETRMLPNAVDDAQVDLNSLRAQYTEYTRRIEETLNEQAWDTYTPDLEMLVDMMQTFDTPAEVELDE